MDVEKKIDELQKLVSKYDTESFAGFFSFFMKRHPAPAADIDLNKFGSKLKDFLYLIALNVFSNQKGTEKLEFSNRDIGRFADKLNQIKDFYYPKKLSDYNEENILHEMALRNHFDNGVLSYVEQDIEKLRRVFTPFEEIIIEDFGFDINFLIEIGKEIELISMIRAKKQMSFMHSKEFADFNNKIQSKKESFSKSFDLLSEENQDAFHSFFSKTYAHLMFRAEELYNRLDAEKVDKFLSLFSCEPAPDAKVRYYTAENPFELKPLLKFPNGNYLSLYGKQIPISIYKILYAHLFNDPNHNVKLRKHREKSLEQKVEAVFGLAQRGLNGRLAIFRADENYHF